MDTQLLRIPEVARALGLSRSRTYELLGSEIRVIRIGRAVRVPQAEVSAYVARKLAQAEAGR